RRRVLPGMPAAGRRSAAPRSPPAPRCPRARLLMGERGTAPAGARGGGHRLPAREGAGADDRPAPASVPRGRPPGRGQAHARRAGARVRRALHPGDPRPVRHRRAGVGAARQWGRGPPLRRARPGGVPPLARGRAPARRVRPAGHRPPSAL
ncbi:MAG: hypothetical protein AVDCRST_MAG33-2713, partial [uncultured Thermomicrobiales bacterium]